MSVLRHRSQTAPHAAKTARRRRHRVRGRRLFLEPLEARTLLAAGVYGSGQFVDSGQSLGNDNGRAVELGDLDGDGDLDAFVANSHRGNRILVNNEGVLTDSGQILGDHNSLDVALGDLDGDGDLDAVVANAFQGNRVWLNDAGVFTSDGQNLGIGNSTGIALGDLDGDGDLDAFVANRREGNRVWLNNGGQLIDSGQNLGSNLSYSVTLGDVDGDGDLDAFVANVVQGNRVWLNDGGVFADSGQSLGVANSFDVSLGDLDGDGDLDAFVANFFQGNVVWENTGGEFQNSNQNLGGSASSSVSVADLDADGDLDAFVANSFHGNRVWLNEGGQFSDSGQNLGSSSTNDAALGDLDSDGDLDVLTVNGLQANRLWLDPLSVIKLGIAAEDAVRPEDEAASTGMSFTVTRSGNTEIPAAVFFTVEGSGDDPADATDFGNRLPRGVVTFAAGEVSQTITIEVVGDKLVEGDEEFSVTLSSAVPSEAQIVTESATGVILNDDLNGLANVVSSLPENTDTSGGVRVADVIAQEGSELALTGADAQHFEIAGGELRLRPDTPLDFESQPQLDVSLELVETVEIGGKAVPPHRQGDNLFTDASINRPTDWYVLNDTIFDTSVSRTDDESGSWKLTTPYPSSEYSRVISKFITFDESGLYHLSFFVRSTNGLSYLGHNLRRWGPQFQSLGNTDFGFNAPAAGDWQEIIVPVEIDVSVSPNIQLHFYKLGNIEDGGTLWVDDIHFGISSATSSVASQPHLSREGPNLFTQTSSNEGFQFIPQNDTVYDPTISHTPDQTGSWKLSTPFDALAPYSIMVSSFITAPETGEYTLSFFMRTEGGPSYIGYNLRRWDENFSGLGNSDWGNAGVSGDGKWEEVVVPIYIDASVSPNIQVRLFHRSTARGRSNGPIWVDDFYFGRGGPTFEKPPPEQRVPFEGSRTRVDELGNFEVLKDGEWEPFFPWAMHTDSNREDWTAYADQGWNVAIWNQSSDSVQKAADAGLMSGFRLAHFANYQGGLYNRTDILEKQIEELIELGLDDDVLFYYWDNENSVSQWEVPLNVMQTVQATDVDENGQRMHPIYVLQGQYNTARSHAAAGSIDVSGTYVSGQVDVVDQSGANSFTVLNNVEGNNRPNSIAQINSASHHPGTFRMRVYNSLIAGARGIGYFADSALKEPAIEDASWAPDMPALANEVDSLMPIIREPHWTSWSVQHDNPRVEVGTRELDGRGHIFLVNQTSTEQEVTLAVDDFPYLPGALQDFFDGSEVASFTGQSVTLTVPPIDIGSGTMVLEITEGVPRREIVATYSLSITDVNESPEIALSQSTGSISEDTDTSSGVLVANVNVTDDALGENTVSLIGPDTDSFEIAANELRLRPNTVLDFSLQPFYHVVVEVDDATIAGSPDDAASFTLSVTGFSGGGEELQAVLGADPLIVAADLQSEAGPVSPPTLPVVAPLDNGFAVVERGPVISAAEESDRSADSPTSVEAVDELFSALADLES